MPSPAPFRASRLLPFLREISGRRTLLGIHNDLKAGGPDYHSERMRALIGRSPALWSGDFLFDERRDRRWDVVREAERQWRAGAVVNLMYHAAPPGMDEPCAWEGGVLSRLSESAWIDLVTEGGSLNERWKARLDSLVPYLGWLRDRGVEALFRPLHEMNQEKFWWGGRPGPEGSPRLWRLTHEYLVRGKGLDNLVWTWDVQDLRFDWDGYDPGGDAYDVLAVDMYQMGFTEKLYRQALALARGKPMGLGEVARFPDARSLAAQPGWAFAMGWADLPFETHSPESLRALAADPRMLLREDMPGWDGQPRSGPVATLLP
jgi:mannan endo-1,4-beta-mannosidase